MKREIKPCLGCVHRHIGCHADWREYRSAEFQNLRKDHDAARFKIDGVRKARAYLHKHKQK